MRRRDRSATGDSGVTRRAAIGAAIALAAALVAGCSQAGNAADRPVPVRLGYLPNITHAPGVAGVEQGFFTEQLGSAGELRPTTFKAGPEAVEALFSGALDMAYVGPNPAINAYQRSGGEAIRIVAGSTSGGAALVVKPDINSAADLEGKTLATPQLGNTQDVALRTWLAGEGFETDFEAGGDVSIRPQENAQTLETFRSGNISGAWVPEPWATRLVQEGDGKVLVDEATLWPGGRYVTAHLVVRKAFLDAHPDLVARMLEAHVRSIGFLDADPAAGQAVVNAGIEKLTGKALPDDVIRAAWPHLTFTEDPVAASLHKSAEDAAATGLLESTDIDGIYDLGPLNSILQAQGRQPVADT